MQNQLLITKKEDMYLSAWAEDGRIRQIQADSLESKAVLGNIYVGKVRNVVKNINAAFIEFQKGQMGYLSLNDCKHPIHTDAVIRNDDRVLIGDEIIVQVEKEAVKTKPPTLSAKLDFSGKYIVLSAGGERVSVSRKIRDKEVRLISADGEQLGIMSSRDAMKLAQEAELDLVKIAPGAKPPVCKIIDYGKYKYEQTRKEKEAKKKQKTVEIKEVRLSPNIDTNDLNTKVNNAKKFISKGNKVKVTLRFRGREMAHVQQSKHILDDFAKQLEDVATVEKAAKLEGRNMSMVLTEKR